MRIPNTLITHALHHACISTNDVGADKTKKKGLDGMTGGNGMVPSNARPRPHVRVFKPELERSANKVFMGGPFIGARYSVPRSVFSRGSTGCRDSHPTKINPTPPPERVTAVNQFSGLRTGRGQPQETRQAPVPEDPVGSKSTTRVGFPMASIPFLLPSRTACSSCSPGPPS